MAALESKVVRSMPAGPNTRSRIASAKGFPAAISRARPARSYPKPL